MSLGRLDTSLLLGPLSCLEGLSIKCNTLRKKEKKKRRMTMVEIDEMRCDGVNRIVTGPLD